MTRFDSDTTEGFKGVEEGSTGGIDETGISDGDFCTASFFSAPIKSVLKPLLNLPPAGMK